MAILKKIEIAQECLGGQQVSGIVRRTGDFASALRNLTENIADVLVTPAANYFEVARRWTTAVCEGHANLDSLEDSLSHATADISEIVGW